MMKSKIKFKLGDPFALKASVAAHNLIHQYLPYEDLCWELAELYLIYEKGPKKYTEHDVWEKSKELFEISPSYRQICYLICLYKYYLEEMNLYP